MKLKESKKVFETKEGLLVPTSRIKITSINEPLICTTFLRTCTAILIKTKDRAYLAHYYSRWDEVEFFLDRIVNKITGDKEIIMFPGIYTSFKAMDYLTGKYGPCKLQNPFVLFNYRCYGDNKPFFQPVGSIAYDFSSDILYGYDRGEKGNILFSYDENYINISDANRKNELFLEPYKEFKKIRWRDPEEVDNYGKSL